MAQGDPLAMIAYGIGIIPLINSLKREVQPWYADDAGALGMSARLETYFDLLASQGPGQGYYPKPTKSVVILCPENTEARKVFGLVVPDVTPQITCACAHLKSVTCSEHFSSLDILRAYDQYTLVKFGLIPPSRALAC